MIAQILFVLVCAGVAIVTPVWSFRRDRWLGWAVVAGLAIYILGAVAVSPVLQAIHGRTYISSDELGYLGDGGLILDSWRTGRPYDEGMRGAYTFWNAIVVGIWGPTALPQRVANALLGVIAIAAAYLIADLVFRSRRAARAAALLMLASPSMALWTVQNLRERMLSLAVMLAVLTGLALIRTWSVWRLVGFLVALTALCEVRVFIGPLVAWAALGTYFVASSAPLRSRIQRGVVLTASVAVVLQIATHSFMGTGIRHETLARSVVLPPATTLASGEGVVDAPGNLLGAVPATFPDNPLVLVHSLWTVLFGRYESQNNVGKISAFALTPEWLMTFLLVPLAVWGTVREIRMKRREVLLPAAFCVLCILGLTWLHDNDTWTTLRHRAVYWPLLLCLAAGGWAFALTWLESKKATKAI